MTTTFISQELSATFITVTSRQNNILFLIRICQFRVCSSDEYLLPQLFANGLNKTWQHWGKLQLLHSRYVSLLYAFVSPSKQQRGGGKKIKKETFSLLCEWILAAKAFVTYGMQIRMCAFHFYIEVHQSFTARVNKGNHYFTTSYLTWVWQSITLLKAHFLYYLSYSAEGNKIPLTASYWFLCGCGGCVVHTAIMMSQTSISTKNFTTLLWAWLGNGSALYCKLLCWLRESLPWELGWLRRSRLDRN